ncbi:MAG: preprotein translocase subunit YajC [Acidimicrobiales bacterium]
MTTDALPLILIYAAVLAVFYFFMYRPRKAAQVAAETARNSLEVGDEVVLDAGIHGFIAALEEKTAWVEVADKVELKVSRSAIAAKLNTQLDDNVND